MLGFAGGLPYVVATVTVQGMLTSARASEAAIGAFSLLLLPYTLKVLWAPLVDALMPPRLRGVGRRRAWITLAQIVIAAALLGLAISVLVVGGQSGGEFAPQLGSAIATDLAVASTSPASDSGVTQVTEWLLSASDLRLLSMLVLAWALLMTFASATQDVSSDAYRIDISPPETRAAAASVFVMGYRAALALLGAGSLILSGRLARDFGQAIGWSATFFALALIMFAMIFATWWAPEPVNDAPEQAPAGERLKRAIIEPFRDLWQRIGARMIAMLFFIFIFKLPDNLALPMTLPFLHKHLHYEMESIGWVRQAVGVGVTIGGALLGAVIVPMLGMRRSLLLFGVVQAVSTASFAWLAMHAASIAPVAPGTGALALAVVIEYLGVGLVTAGFVAFLMSICNPRYSATQYALLTAVMTLGIALAGAWSGRLFEMLRDWSGDDATIGWTRFFLVCVASGAVGILLVPFVTVPRAVERANDEALRDQRQRAEAQP